jgi:hypothetical protein
MKYGFALIVLGFLSGQSEDAWFKAEEKKAEHWKKVLEKSPSDPEACQGLGRFLCFVKGSWGEGLPFVSRGKDPIAADAAKLDLGERDLGEVKGSPLTGATFEVGPEAAPDVVRGDAWWELSKKYKDIELFNVLSRAIYWYKQALPKVDDAHRKKLQERIDRAKDKHHSLIVRPQGRVLECCPKGWGVVLGKGERIEGVAIDDSRSHSGRNSFRIRGCDHGMLVTERKGIRPGAEFTVSLWYMAEGLSAATPVSIWFIGSEDTTVKAESIPVLSDRGELPSWAKAEVKVKSPDNAVYYRIYINQPGIQNGTLWIDDISMKAAGSDVEMIQNAGFEEK